MDIQSVLDLKKLAFQFRKAIEATGLSSLPGTFHCFPSGSCGDASALLGQFLIDNGYSPVEYICGHKGIQSHAWVQVGSIFVDITADQFADVNEPVIVARDSEWHKQFKIDQGHCGGVDVYDKAASARLRAAYEQVLHHLPPGEA